MESKQYFPGLSVLHGSLCARAFPSEFAPLATPLPPSPAVLSPERSYPKKMPAEVQKLVLVNSSVRSSNVLVVGVNAIALTGAPQRKS